MNKVGNIIQIAQPLSIILSNLFREPLLRLGERDCVCARVIKIESSPVCERKSEGSRSRSAREARCETMQPVPNNNKGRFFNLSVELLSSESVTSELES